VVKRKPEPPSSPQRQTSFTCRTSAASEVGVADTAAARTNCIMTIGGRGVLVVGVVGNERAFLPSGGSTRGPIT